MVSVELRLLGRFDGRLGSGSTIELPTKKTQLLLSFLALSSGQVHPREKLASLLWSDRGVEQAHHSLRSSLSALRKAFAEAESPPLLADRETVSLDPGAVEVDAVEFENLVAAGTLEALEKARELYRGELLEGESPRDPPAEEWLFYERNRLHDLALRAFEQLLELQREAGQIGPAIETAQGLLKLNPAHEKAHRALMRLYADQQRRAAALEQYQRCRAALKRELDVEPGPESEQLYQEILHRRGERPGKASAFPEQHRPRRWAALGAVAVLLAGAAVFGVWQVYLGPAEQISNGAPALPLPDKPSIAVLPFDNLSDDPARERLADGITEDIITDLSRYPDFFVIARNSTFVYKASLKSAIQVAEELGVRYVLEGSLQVSGNRARVTAQLIDTRDGHHVWAERYERPLDDIFALQDEVSRSIAGALTGYSGRLSEAGLEIARRKPPESLTAYDYLLLGAGHKNRFTKDDNAKAKVLLHKAIEIDPEFARAYVALAWTHVIDLDNRWSPSPAESVERFREAALKAVALDRTDAEANIQLGIVHSLDGDVVGALRAIKRAIELAPNNADVLVKAAWNMSSIAGKDGAARAVALIERAMRLNPIYPGWYDHGLGNAQYFAHRFEDAVVTLRSARPATFGVRLHLAASYAQLGLTGKAAALKADLLHEDPRFSGRAYAEAMGVIDEDALAHFLDGLRKAGLPE